MQPLTPQSHSKIMAIKFLHLLLFDFHSRAFPCFISVSLSSICMVLAHINAVTDAKDTVRRLYSVTVLLSK